MLVICIGGRSDKALVEEDEMINPNYVKQFFVLKNGKTHAFFVDKDLNIHIAKEMAEGYIHI